MDVGGQAVIEGVMMRNKERFAVAVRKKEGNIEILEETSKKFPKFFNIFFLRGVVGLGYTVYDGLRALLWSGNQQEEKEEKASSWEVTVALGGSFIFALLVFVGLPFLIAHMVTDHSFWFNVLDGVLRVSFIFTYILAISFMDDVKTLFQYHGAEHKAIICHEKKQPLTVENAKKCTRFHPRCGTSFVFLVLLLSIVIFSLLKGAWWFKLAGRIALLPVIAGIGYELIKLSGKYATNPFVKIIITPGLWFQRLTTREPDEKQLEVAIAALEKVT